MTADTTMTDVDTDELGLLPQRLRGYADDARDTPFFGGPRAMDERRAADQLEALAAERDELERLAGALANASNDLEYKDARAALKSYQRKGE